MKLPQARLRDQISERFTRGGQAQWMGLFTTPSSTDNLEVYAVISASGTGFNLHLGVNDYATTEHGDRGIKLDVMQCLPDIELFY